MYCYMYSGSLYRMFFHQMRHSWIFNNKSYYLLQKFLLGTTWLIQFDELLSINSFVMCPKALFACMETET